VSENGSTGLMGGMFEAGDVQLSRLCLDRVDNKPYCLLSLSVELCSKCYLELITATSFQAICQMRDELKNKYKVDHVDEQLTPDDVEEM
jgi:hypothetical protein